MIFGMVIISQETMYALQLFYEKQDADCTIYRTKFNIDTSEIIFMSDI